MDEEYYLTEELCANDGWIGFGNGVANFSSDQVQPLTEGIERDSQT